MSRPKKKPKCEARTLIQKAHKYLAEPTGLQEYRMENWFGSLRHLSNESIAERKDAYRAAAKGLTYTEQQNALPAKRKQDPALRMVHSQVTQDCLQRVEKAFQKFFDDVKAKKSGIKVKIGYPRFKKLDRYKSFTFPQVWMTVNDKKTGTTKRLEIVRFRPVTKSMPSGRVKFAYLGLPGIGDLKIRLHRPIDWDTAKTVTVKRSPSGKWSVSITVEKPLSPTLTDNGTKSGVDLGLKKHVAMSDDSYVQYPNFLKQSEDKLKHQQRSLSGKKKGSLNYQNQNVVLAKTHEHIANQRRDFLHKLSLLIVVTYAYVAFEKLNIPGMVKNHNLAKAILDSGWGTLIRFVTYKSVMLRGNQTVTVNPAYTTQDCSRCGYRVPKTLADRVHKCPQCGLVLDRDTNAARNVEQRAFGEVAAYADDVNANLKVGMVCPELTPVEMEASAAPAFAVSSVVEAWKPQLKSHLS